MKEMNVAAFQCNLYTGNSSPKYEAEQSANMCTVTITNVCISDYALRNRKNIVMLACLLMYDTRGMLKETVAVKLDK